ncbi:MAG: hypothetical protein Q8T08_06245 [Ignavibacteria bacterium]|jgi:hypothetical protein|nr:hypothetical protein [Ignavibacteria bacterium]
MNSPTRNKHVNSTEPEVIKHAFPQLRKKLLLNVDQAKSVFVHFDHIQGESEIDRHQIFSNLLKAVSYLGLDAEKIDFHRKDA